MAGNVNRSPNAAMIGLVMLSGSHPCSKLLNETNIVIGSMIALEIAPAIILINMKSINDIDSKLNTIQKILARIAKNKDNIIVKTKADMILLFNCSDNSNFGEIIPICKFVESLDANDPKIFPIFIFYNKNMRNKKYKNMQFIRLENKCFQSLNFTRHI